MYGVHTYVYGVHTYVYDVHTYVYDVHTYVYGVHTYVYLWGCSISSVKLRLESESEDGMSCAEFLYPIFQGYDFLHLHRNHNCWMQVTHNPYSTNLINACLGSSQKKIKEGGV